MCGEFIHSWWFREAEPRRGLSARSLDGPSLPALAHGSGLPVDGCPFSVIAPQQPAVP
jgi:hypothetical protein